MLQAVHAALDRTGGVLKDEVGKLRLLADEPEATEYATQVCWAGTLAWLVTFYMIGVLGRHSTA